MDPASFVSFFSVLFPYAIEYGGAASGVKALLNGPAPQQAADATAAEYSIDGLANVLKTWARSGELAGASERLVAGRGSDVERVLDSFLNTSGFRELLRGFPDSKIEEVGREVVAKFIDHLEDIVYAGERGAGAMLRRVEALSTEIRDSQSTNNSQVAALTVQVAGLQSMLATFVDKNTAGDTTTANAALIAGAQVTIAGRLLERKRVVSARTVLEQVEQLDLPDVTIRFRVESNLGTCAVAVGDLAGALRHWERAEVLMPSRTDAQCRLAIGRAVNGDTTGATASLVGVDVAAAVREGHLFLLVEAWTLLGREDEFDKLVSTYREAMDVRALLAVARGQSRFGDPEAARKTAEAALAIDREAPDSLALLGELLFESALDTPGPILSMSHSARERVREARRLLQDAWEAEYKYCEDPGQKAFVPLLLARCCGVLTDLDALIKWCDEVLSFLPISLDALRMKAIALIQLRRAAEARGILEKSDRRDVLLAIPYANACSVQGDYREAVAALLPFVSIPGEQREAVAILVCDAYRHLNEDTGAVLIAALRDDSPDDLELVIAQANDLEAQGCPGAAIELLLSKAPEGAPNRRRIDFEVARSLFRQEKYSEAVPYFRRIVSHPGDPMAAELLAALINAGDLEGALEQALAMRPFEDHLAVALEAEGRIRAFVGETDEALPLLREASRLESTKPSLRLQYVELLLRVGAEQSAREELSELPLQEWTGDPLAVLRIAHHQLVLGIPEFIETAYSARRAGDARPDVQVAYLPFALKAEQQGLIALPDAAGPGTAVIAEEVSGGEQFNFVILDEGETALDESELSPDSVTAQALLGHRKDDVLKLRSPIFGSRTRELRIREIRSKYGWAATRTYQDFETRFPESNALRKIPVEPDLQSYLHELKSRKEFAEKVMAIYADPGAPLHMIADRLGINDFQMWRALTVGTGGPGFQVRHNTPDEASYENSIGDVQCVTLDLSALLTIERLGLADLVRRGFARVLVSREALDDLRGFVLSGRAQPDTGGWASIDDEGRPTLAEDTDANRNDAVETLRRATLLAESLEVMPDTARLHLSREERDQEDEVLGTSAAASIRLGLAQSALLIVDDTLTSVVARQRGVPAISVFGLIRLMGRRGLIAPQHARHLRQRLFEMNYTALPLNGEDLLWFVSDHRIESLVAVARQFRREVCDLNGLLAVLPYALAWLWTRRIDIDWKLFASVLAGALRSHEDPENLLNMLLGRVRAVTRLSIRPLDELDEVMREGFRSSAPIA